MFPSQWQEEFCRRFGFGTRTASQIEASIPKLIEEMDELNIELGVANGRNVPIIPMPNEELALLQKDYPNRFIGFAGIDPSRAIHRRPLDEVDKSIKQLGLKGVSMDYAWVAGTIRDSVGYYPDDTNKLYPIYAKCEELGVPVMLTGGPKAFDHSYTDPTRFARVARDFRNLKIIISHAVYPQVRGLLAAAFRNENLFISPDVYIFLPGAGPYIEAINSEALGDQMLFASSYPVAPLKACLEKTLKLDIKEAALEKYLFKNAARVLGMNE